MRVDIGHFTGRTTREFFVYGNQGAVFDNVAKVAYVSVLRISAYRCHILLSAVPLKTALSFSKILSILALS